MTRAFWATDLGSFVVSGVLVEARGMRNKPSRNRQKELRKEKASFYRRFMIWFKLKEEERIYTFCLFFYEPRIPLWYIGSGGKGREEGRETDRQSKGKKKRGCSQPAHKRPKNFFDIDMKGK